MSHRSTVVVGLICTALALTACSSGDSPAAVDTPAAPTSSTAPQPTVTPSPSTAPTSATTNTASSTAPTTRATIRTTTRPATTSAKPSPTPSKRRTTTPLPLDLSTGNATQVVTVVSDDSSATTATLQRWTRSGSGWRKTGAGVDAYLGHAGIGKASEGSSKTPAGSFTLTQAFGRDGNPGTRLPYVRTNPDDYWISSPGKNYNTRQRCGDCGYKNGVNERLYYVTPEYEHAVVIDYNTANAPGGVKPGKGSAFFLHVAAGKPTEGCVSIPSAKLDDVMRWLDPAKHPRILIGVA